MSSSNEFIDLDTFNETLDDGVNIPFFTGLRNTTIKVVKLWKPEGIYTAQFDSQTAKSAGGMLAPVKMVLRKRNGLFITLRMKSGSYQQVHVQCTDELWDDILKHNIYKYNDDDIYLRFNEEGVAFEYVVNSKQIPAAVGQIPSEEYSKRSRILHVSDALQQKLSNDFASGGQGAAAKLDDILGTTVIYKFVPDVGVKIKYASSKVNQTDVQEVRDILQAKMDEHAQLEKLELLGEKGLLADIRDNGTAFYVNFDGAVEK